jgi:hypothetical protein
MVHVTLHPNLNLERLKITSRAMPEIFDKISTKYRWPEGKLEDLRALVLLTSPNPGERKPINDRTALRRFWETLIESLGGRLETFDHVQR